MMLAFIILRVSGQFRYWVSIALLMAVREAAHRRSGACWLIEQLRARRLPIAQVMSSGWREVERIAPISLTGGVALFSSCHVRRTWGILLPAMFLTRSGEAVAVWRGRCSGRCSSVVEQGTHKPLVVGSNPSAATWHSCELTAPTGTVSFCLPPCCPQLDAGLSDECAVLRYGGRLSYEQTPTSRLAIPQ